MFRLGFIHVRLERNKEMKGTYYASNVWQSIQLGRFHPVLSENNSADRTKSPKKVHPLHHGIRPC